MRPRSPTPATSARTRSTRTGFSRAPGKANEAKIVDYFYRAPHQATVAAKLVAAAFYGAPKVSRAYFDGCSFGGHMGLMEAMRYPDDYDGVIAGAPYMDNYTQLWGYKNAKAFLNAYVPADVVAKVNDAVLAACDAEDGAKDGLIQNPAKCSFDPQSLVPSVLTQTQADAFKTFMRPGDRRARPHALSRIADQRPRGGRRTGRRVHGMGRGRRRRRPDPAAAEPWGARPPVLWAAAEGFIKPIDLRDPNLDFNNQWPEKDGQISDEALSQFDERMGVGNADQPERLAPFFAAGKKLILYHGYGDTAISPFRTVWFYEDLAKGLGGYDKRERACAALHGSGDAALPRRRRPQQFRYAQRARSLGGTGQGAGGHPCGETRRRPAGETGPNDAALPVPCSGRVQGDRRRQFRGELDVPGRGRVAARNRLRGSRRRNGRKSGSSAPGHARPAAAITRPRPCSRAAAHASRAAGPHPAHVRRDACLRPRDETRQDPCRPDRAFRLPGDAFRERQRNQADRTRASRNRRTWPGARATHPGPPAGGRQPG